MKKGLFLMIGVLALTSCIVRVGKWNSKIIAASDNIVTKEYRLTAFEEVAMQCAGDVELIQSDTIDGLVALTAPDNYVELYQFESKAGKLDISFSKDDINIDSEHVKIKVYTTSLTRLQNSGEASISMDSLRTDHLKVANSGVGSFSLRKMMAGNVTLSCSGVGSISMSGQCENADMSCSGVGSINAKDLKSQNTKAHVSGVGSISCYASEYLDGKVTGVGSLKYAGNPKSVDKNDPVTGSITAI